MLLVQGFAGGPRLWREGLRWMETMSANFDGTSEDG